MPVETPRATYRLQMHKGFNFDDAAAIAGYLAELGVSHVYTSPSLQATPGSNHGYDVVDFSRLNEELGGEEGSRRLADALKASGLKWLLDIVPNHMAIETGGNRWWWDVLENGQSSRYASYFDVDWDSPEAKLRNTVLLPILGDHYGLALDRGEIQLCRQEGSFFIEYFEHQMPVAPRSLDNLLAAAAELAGSPDLAFIAQSYSRLPLATATDRRSVHSRHRDKEVLRRQLTRLVGEKPEIGRAIDEVMEAVNGDPDGIDGLLERQNYRLAFWRTAGRELDYRRFFDVSSLIGLRAEDEQVFEDTHRVVLDLMASGAVDGFRVDHIDGLREPARYLRKLAAEAPDAWLLVEKILAQGERLPEVWPVAGTSGYDFTSMVDGLFIDQRSELALTDFYAEFTGEPSDWPDLVYNKKHLVMREVLASDVNRLTGLFTAICERHRRYRDYTRHELHEVLRETAACFPVYRTYASAADGMLAEDDVRWVSQAITTASARRAELDLDLFNFLRDILLLRVRGESEDELAMRFQQLTSPVMAKGVEDTAFYCFNRLLCLNEVGGDPGRFGHSPDEFHAAALETQQTWPLTMLATSTHDTKRSEDVRCRLALLSELPGPWAEAVTRWAKLNERHRSALLDRNVEYLLYQTLVGAWPIDSERACAYMEKASKEAKAHTSWIDPNSEYDEALRRFVLGVLADAGFVADLEKFVAPLVEPGRVNSLAQALIKLTAPGVPDIYQGCDLWDLSLVDPDNRRPVDYALRRRLLAEAATATAEDVLSRPDQGLPKIWLIKRVLEARKRCPAWYGPAGGYTPLEASGEKAQHLVAFLRGDEALTVAPRLVLGLAEGWGDTTLSLPRGRWRNQLTEDESEGGVVSVADLLQRFPVALLFRDEAG